MKAFMSQTPFGEITGRVSLADALASYGPKPATTQQPTRVRPRP